MVAPGRQPLAGGIEADETYLGAAKPGRPGRGAAGKAKVAGAVERGRGWGDPALRLPAIHLVFGLGKRWLLGTHHGAVGTTHLQAYLDASVFRFNRRPAKSIAHRFMCVIEHAVQTPPVTYRRIVHGMAA
jgi:hypothetical protein